MRIAMLALLLGVPTGHQATVGEGAASGSAAAPVFIDDEKLMETFDREIISAGKSGKATPWRKLRRQVERKRCRARAAGAGKVVLQPGEVYGGCAGAVLMITSAWRNDDGEWECGEPATAWVLEPDGVVVTNQHVFDGAEDDEVFGVMTRDGKFYPVDEILASDAALDVAVFRIPAKGLQPLPVALDEPVGSRISVISHPDQQFYTFTQGTITRYTLQRDEAGQELVPYMCISADYARGSSGGPVLNDRGAVVGMVCSTMTTYYGRKDEDPDDDVQMVVKFCIPARSIVSLLRSGPAAAEEEGKAEGKPEKPEASKP